MDASEGGIAKRTSPQPQVNILVIGIGCRVPIQHADVRPSEGVGRNRLVSCQIAIRLAAKHVPADKHHAGPQAVFAQVQLGTREIPSDLPALGGGAVGRSAQRAVVS